MRANHIPLLAAIAAMVGGSSTWAQVPYPPHVIQGVSWSSGTHHTAVTNKILSPGVASHPVSITGTADAEFVSATEVRLTDGFHAGGFSGNGRFHARIDEALGDPADLVVIAPKPATHVIDNILHVEKWEKLEIGLRLPQEYQDAIDAFFAHYYSNGTTQDATPGNVDPMHDLNPYADDSLQLVMHLTKPSGTETLKWGYFMREGKWSGTLPTSILVQNTSSTLYPYHIRFRLAPDEEGTWQFSLSIKAPNTSTLSNDPLPALLHTGFTFICDPPLPDNKGFLQVNQANRRIMKFETGEPFFGLGMNMIPDHSGVWPYWSDPNSYRITRHTYDRINETFSAFQTVGGNYARMFLGDMEFAPEYVNLGVYDSYRAALTCGNTPVVLGNCQYQCWAFDQVLDLARVNGIYLQLCVEPYPPIIDYETFSWYHDPYMNQFVKPHVQAPPLNLYDMKRYFYKDGDPDELDEGVFYYWKRKYKYLMARWGYSVNIAALEFFNETDQMLTYRHVDLDPPPQENPPAMCSGHFLDWQCDTNLPATIDDWITDITTFVRDPVDLTDPAHSPLGEDKKLFHLSFTDYMPLSMLDPEDGVLRPDHYLPLKNANVDLIDTHHGLGANDDQIMMSFDQSAAYRDALVSNGEKKPFNRGEHGQDAKVDLDGNGSTEYESGPIFDNYDISFHNEVWAGAFFGNFATGMTWRRDWVFWWEEVMPIPPHDDNNAFQQDFFNGINQYNSLDVAGQEVVVENLPSFKHFKPLSDLLSNPDWLAYDFYGSEYDAYRSFDASHRVECYYLKNTSNTLAIGWIHNLNAYWENGYHVTSATQNYLGCDAPYLVSTWIDDLLPFHDYYVTWFPTRMNTTVCPDDYQYNSGLAGAIPLDLSTEPLGGISGNHLDTLHSDYAFIISIGPIEKSLILPSAGDTIVSAEWDFILFPNPVRDELNLWVSDDANWDVHILDPMGRLVFSRNGLKGPVSLFSIGHLAKGAYWIRVSSAAKSKVKRLVIH